jgi:hypothetical protein
MNSIASGLLSICERIPRLTAPIDQPWGMREFALVDPSGNLVRVGHDLDATAVYRPEDVGT